MKFTTNDTLNCYVKEATINYCRVQQLNCDIKTAWVIFSSPYNLLKITPEDMGFTVISDLGDE